ncbi:MAG TPA: ribokinase, partial [Verrucomicrobiales bacterium]|nr:ribokinase [Verrucomicrobiales bacterium]
MNGNFRTQQIIVAGSINIDIVARTARHPRAGETVAGSDLQLNLGGKGANQAVAAARLMENGQTLLLGKVGSDPFGDRLVQELKACGVRTFITADPAEATGTALITLAQEDNTIVIIPAANARFTDADIDESLIGPGDICVAQLEIPVPAVEGFFRKARRKGATCLLNAAPAPAESIRSILALTDCLVVNETEVEALTSEVISSSNTESIRVAASKLELAATQTLIVTLGAGGCV